MIEILDVITILVAGLMVGNELAIAAFVHPAFHRLPDDAHASSAIAVARILGRVMPFWYALVLLLTLIDAFAHWHSSGQVPRLIAASAILWAVSIAYSIGTLVPINNRIASWAQQTRPANWKTYRQRWDRLHRWRVLLLVLSYTALIVGIQHPGF